MYANYDICVYVCVFVDVPVFPTVTAVVTLDKYEPCTSPAELFAIPAEYSKVSF